MSDTHRTHLPWAKLRQRGGRLKPTPVDPKSHKQRRVNERVKLRRAHF